MRRHDPSGVDAAVARLAGDVDRLQREVTSLALMRADVDAHGRALHDLADVVRRTADRPAQPAEEGDEDAAPAPEWLTITDAELAVAWLADLDQWTRDVWRHHHGLLVCWPWHPDVVAELLWCRHMWAAATEPGTGAGALAAWHDRWRPGVAERVARALAACERTDGRHVVTGAGDWVVDPTVLDELAVWWATTHGAGPAPGLTREARR